MNTADFTTPNQSSKILILKIEMLLEFQNKRNNQIIGVLINAFWILLRIARYRFVKYRYVRYTFRFVRSPDKYFVSLNSVFKTSLRYVFKTS